MKAMRVREGCNTKEEEEKEEEDEEELR